MPYDEHLAVSARAVLLVQRGVSERKMFGGIAFMLDDRMFGGIVGREFIVRLGRDAKVDEPHTRPMDFTGRPLRGVFFVEPAGLETESQIQRWLDRAIVFVRTLPVKRRCV